MIFCYLEVCCCISNYSCIYNYHSVLGPTTDGCWVKVSDPTAIATATADTSTQGNTVIAF